MNENTFNPLLGPDGNHMSGREYLESFVKQLPKLPADTADTTQVAVSDPTENLSSSDEKNISETDEKISSTETIFSVSESIKNPPEDTVKSVDTPVVSLGETDVPVRRNPFPPLVQVPTTEGKDSVSPVEDSDVVNEKNSSEVTGNNDIPESEKSSDTENERKVPEEHIIPTSSLGASITPSTLPIATPTSNAPTFPLNILNDHQPLSKFEEGFAKTLPIEDFPWKGREKKLPDGDTQHEATSVNTENTEDETPFSRAIRSDVSHTSGAIRKFWSKVNDDLSCLDGALSCVGGTPDDTEWVKEQTRALFESVYTAMESLREDVFDAAETDVRDFLDSEQDSNVASSEIDSDTMMDEIDYLEVPGRRGEGLERWARWVGRNEDGIIVLQKAPYWTDNNESEVCSTEAIRDSGVDINILADILKNDIGKTRKIIREVAKEKGIDFIFRHPKGMRNSTGRLLTSRQEATISGSGIGYITLEGFFETLAYALAKSSKMNE